MPGRDGPRVKNAPALTGPRRRRGWRPHRRRDVRPARAATPVADLEPRRRDGPARPASHRQAACRSSSAIRTVPGSARPTKTSTDCCARTWVLHSAPTVPFELETTTTFAPVTHALASRAPRQGARVTRRSRPPRTPLRAAQPLARRASVERRRRVRTRRDKSCSPRRLHRRGPRPRARHRAAIACVDGWSSSLRRQRLADEVWVREGKHSAGVDQDASIGWLTHRVCQR